MPVSEEMVEIGAKAMHARLRKQAWPDDGGGGSWDPEAGTYQIPEDAKERYRASARACLTAALSNQVVGWQPIKTAPKDGTQVDLWITAPKGALSGGDYGRICDCWLSDGRWWFYDESKYASDPANCRSEVWNVTHWQPRPAPPQPSEDNGPDTNGGET